MLAVLQGRCLLTFFEYTQEIIHIPIAHGLGYLRNGQIRGDQKLFCFRDPKKDEIFLEVDSHNIFERQG